MIEPLRNAAPRLITGSYRTSPINDTEAKKALEQTRAIEEKYATSYKTSTTKCPPSTWTKNDLITTQNTTHKNHSSVPSEKDETNFLQHLQPENNNSSDIRVPKISNRETQLQTRPRHCSNITGSYYKHNKLLERNYTIKFRLKQTNNFLSRSSWLSMRH